MRPVCPHRPQAATRPKPWRHADLGCQLGRSPGWPASTSRASQAGRPALRTGRGPSGPSGHPRRLGRTDTTATQGVRCGRTRPGCRCPQACGSRLPSVATPPHPEPWGVRETGRCAASAGHCRRPKQGGDLRSSAADCPRPPRRLRRRTPAVHTRCPLRPRNLNATGCPDDKCPPRTSGTDSGHCGGPSLRFYRNRSPGRRPPDGCSQPRYAWAS